MAPHQLLVHQDFVLLVLLNHAAEARLLEKPAGRRKMRPPKTIARASMFLISTKFEALIAASRDGSANCYCCAQSLPFPVGLAHTHVDEVRRARPETARVKHALAFAASTQN